MNCEETRTWLSGHLDEELDIARSAEVEQHIAGCAECRKAHQEGLVLREGLREADLYYEPPPGLANKLRREVRKSAAAGVEWRPVSFRWPWAAAAALALAVLVMAVRIRPAAEQRIAAEIVASHVRSLQANHLMDVASTDRHTVKPWFQGKLDFSPPVPDLPELTGGRLDYVGGRPVAALVYQRRQHRINVFVWPGEGKADPATKSSNGYQLVHWRGAGMEWWAVSDMNGTELAEFAKSIMSGE